MDIHYIISSCPTSWEMANLIVSHFPDGNSDHRSIGNLLQGLFCKTANAQSPSGLTLYLGPGCQGAVGIQNFPMTAKEMAARRRAPVKLGLLAPGLLKGSPSLYNYCPAPGICYPLRVLLAKNRTPSDRKGCPELTDASSAVASREEPCSS